MVAAASFSRGLPDLLPGVAALRSVPRASVPPTANCVIKGGEGESASREGGPNRPCPIADMASHPLRHVPLVRSKCQAPLLAGGGEGAHFPRAWTAGGGVTRDHLG